MALNLASFGHWTLRDKASAVLVDFALGGDPAAQHCQPKKRNHYVSPNFDWPLIAGGIALFESAEIVVVQPNTTLKRDASKAARSLA